MTDVVSPPSCFTLRWQTDCSFGGQDGDTIGYQTLAESRDRSTESTRDDRVAAAEKIEDGTSDADT